MKPDTNNFLLHSASIFSILTFGSRILGYLRDIAIFASFGVGVAVDAFLIAFRLPNLLRRIFAEGACSMAFVPIYQRLWSQNNTKEANMFASNVCGFLMLALFALSAAGVLLAPMLIVFLAPGFIAEGKDFDLSVQLLRITAPYLFFIALTSFAAAILNSRGHFAIPAIAPAVLNIILIIAAVVVSPRMDIPVEALAWGVLLGGLVQLGIQLPVLVKKGVFPVPRFHFRNPQVRQCIRAMLPSSMAACATQINLLVDTAIASFLVAGSISWLYISSRFVEIPLALLGVSLSTVIFPSLSRLFAKNDQVGFSRVLFWSVRASIVLALPSSVGLILLSTPILISLLGYGDVTYFDIQMASWSLMIYAFGIPSFVLVKILSSASYAAGYPWEAAKAAFGSVTLNVVLSVVLVSIWEWKDMPAGHAVLSFTTVVSSWLNVYLLHRALRATTLRRMETNWISIGFKALVSVFVMAFLLWVFLPDLVIWTDWGIGQRFLNLSLFVFAGIAIYCATLRVCGVNILRFLKN